MGKDNIPAPEAHTIYDAWDHRSPWPTIVYVETSNYCNANCVVCPYSVVEVKKSIMSLDTFKLVADKVKARNLKIGGMFCFGEPLTDPTIFRKYEYGNSIGVMDRLVGFNTNVSLLTPDKWDDILNHTPNIVLSFYNVGAKYEELTRTLKWDISYKNAIDFIEYRDKVKPGYPIAIGVSAVSGYDADLVRQAFNGYNVYYQGEPELRYNGGEFMDGVTDRLYLFPHWRCDGFKGAIQVKADLSTLYCAYDVIRYETKIGHFLDNSWEELEANFRSRWRAGSTWCRRCDFWHLSKRVINNGCKPTEDMSWSPESLAEQKARGDFDE